MNADLKIAGAEERHFEYQNVSVDYYLVLEKRKTLSMTVFPSQALLVKAPARASMSHIEGFLRRKLCWVLKQKRYFEQFKRSEEKRYLSGESFRYRGRSHKLLIRKNGTDEHISLQHGTLNVFTSSPQDHLHTKGLLQDWYIHQARRIFAERLSVCFPMFDFAAMPGLAIRRMTRRWGSYSQRTNRIALNLELVKAATRHIDYVIIHELCHMTHKKHDRAFYDLLESRLPQWRHLKKDLELSLLG